MPLVTFSKPKRIGTYTARVKEEAEAVELRATEQARRAFALARAAHALREKGWSLRQIAQHANEQEWREIIPGLTPASFTYIGELERRYRAGARSVEDYRPGRRGRRQRPVDPRVRAEARRLVLGWSAGTPLTRLCASLNEFIVAKGLGEPMSYSRCQGLIRGISREERTAAAFGSRAGELYGTSHATVACRATHKLWTIDAFDAPWNEIQWVPTEFSWVTQCPSILIVKDYKSDCAVGYWISDPSRRRDKNGRPCTTGFDASDVIAAILSAAIPQLAPPATAPLSGYLCEAIRWDRHSVNDSLRQHMRDVAKALDVHGCAFFEQDLPTVDTSIGKDGTVVRSLVRIPELPRRRPKNRGDVERAIDFLKKLCWDVPGHVDRYVPSNLAVKDQGEVRTIGADKRSLQPRRLELALEDLPTREQTAPAFDRVIAAYNQTRNRMHGTTRLERYHQFKPRSPRRGADALALLQTESTFVGESGIEVFHDGISTQFSPVLPAAGLRYALDTQVTGKVDIFQRGFFVRLNGAVHMLPRKDEWAAEPGAAEREAREQRALARSASDEADAIRRRHLDMEAGIGAAARGAAEAAAFREARRDGEVAAVILPDGTRILLNDPDGTTVESPSQDAESGAEGAGDRTSARSGRQRKARPRADQRVVRLHAADEAESSRALDASGELAQATIPPTHAPPPPVTPAQVTVTPETPSASSDARVPDAHGSRSAHGVHGSPRPTGLARAVSQAYAPPAAQQRSRRKRSGAQSPNPGSTTASPRRPTRSPEVPAAQAPIDEALDRTTATAAVSAPTTTAATNGAPSTLDFGRRFRR